MRESEDRYGYCDLHLESKLGVAWSLLASQGGGDSSDGNWLEYWRCSRPECSRCYEPFMFGYFGLDRQRGRGIQMDTQTQERCRLHPEILTDPVLFIGKIGQGRRLRCPIKGCDNIGAVVAEFVAETDDREALPAVRAALRSDARKEAFELSVFREFAQVAGLLAESPENAKPPCPDIRCTIGGELYRFELGRITDTMLAKQIAVEWPNNPKSFSFGQEKPFTRIIERKAQAKYETGGHPVDLVLHFDQQPPDRAALQNHLRKHAAALDELTTRGPFSRVWIYDGWSKSVLWRSAD